MLPKEVTQLIGKRGKPVVLEVEKGAIRKYADAVCDQNPLFWDEEYARKSRFGTMIAPPGFFGWPARWGIMGPFASPPLRQEVMDTLANAGYKVGLYGGAEYSFYHPVYAGDMISATSEVKDIYEREGKTGKLVFWIIKTTYTNQKGQVVAEACDTMIRK